MNLGTCFETAVTQENFTPGDAIGLGPNVIKVTVKCSPMSVNNLYVGINQQATDINVLQPGESVTYYDERVALTDQNGKGLKLYLKFDTTGGTSGGKALVSTIADHKQPAC
jgi:hypothetical protein